VVALDDLERLLGIEPGDQRQRADAGDGRVHAARLSERVEQRQRPQCDRARAEVEQIDREPAVLEQVRMGQLRALRRSGRPRGVEDHGRVGVVDLGGVGDRRCAPDLLLELAGLDERALGAGVLRAGLRVLSEPIPREQLLCARVAQVESDLAMLEQHVHRDDDATGSQHAVVTDGEVGNVREHDPDAVAGLEAVLAEQSGDVRARAVELGVRELGVVELDRYTLGFGSCGFGEDAGEIHYPPVKAAGRFCMNASTPSMKSADSARPCWSTASRSSSCSNCAYAPSLIVRLMFA